METNATPVTPVSVGLRYGLFLAVSSILVEFLIRIIGFSFLVYGVVTFVGALIVAIAWSVVAHSAFKKENAGLMSFSQGLTIILVMMCISGIAAGLFNYVYLNYIDVDFVAKLKNSMTEFMERSNVADDQIAKSTAKFDEMNVGVGMALLNGVKGGVIGGLILGCIVSAFTKRNPPEFE